MNILSNRNTIYAFIKENYGRIVDFEPDNDVNFTSNSYLFLNHKEMEFYFGWRTSVRNGKYPKANFELMRFFFLEMFVVKENLNTIEKWGKLLFKVYRGTDAGEIAQIIVTECYLNRCEFPDAQYIKSNKFLIDELLLAGPKIDVGPYEVEGYLDETPKNKEFYVELNKVLSALSELLWEEKDLGIIEYLSNKRTEVRMRLFKIFYDDTDYSIIMDLPSFDDLCDFRLMNIIEYCRKKFINPKSRRPSNVDEIVDRAIQMVQDDKYVEHNYDCFLPKRTIHLYPDDGRAVKGIYYRSEGRIPYEQPVFIHKVEYEWVGATYKRPSKKELTKMIDSRIVKECGYVPSRYKCPPIQTLTEKQKDYFIYWRSEALKGHYLDTDIGYISLRLFEIVLCEESQEKAMRDLTELDKVYDLVEIKETCMSYALSNGLPLPGYDDYVYDPLGGWNYIVILEALKKEPIGLLGPRVLYAISNVKGKYREIDDPLFSKLTNRILRKFDEQYLKDEGRRLCQMTRGFKKHLYVPTYENLYEYKLRDTKKFENTISLMDGDLVDILYASAIIAARYVCKKNGCTMPRIDPDLDVKVARLAESFLLRAISELE